MMNMTTMLRDNLPFHNKPTEWKYDAWYVEI